MNLNCRVPELTSMFCSIPNVDREATFPRQSILVLFISTYRTIRASSSFTQMGGISREKSNAGLIPLPRLRTGIRGGEFYREFMKL